jgi:hypothetical protein
MSRVSRQGKKSSWKLSVKEQKTFLEFLNWTSNRQLTESNYKEIAGKNIDSTIARRSNSLLHKRAVHKRNMPAQVNGRRYKSIPYYKSNFDFLQLYLKSINERDIKNMLNPTIATISLFFELKEVRMLFKKYHDKSVIQESIYSSARMILEKYLLSTWLELHKARKQGLDSGAVLNSKEIIKLIKEYQKNTSREYTKLKQREELANLFNKSFKKGDIPAYKVKVWAELLYAPDMVEDLADAVLSPLGSDLVKQTIYR